MRATFITLAIEDGADPDVIETRVTHTRKARNVFDGYNRGLHWERTCAEISKLWITRGSQSTAIDNRSRPAAGMIRCRSLQIAVVARHALEDLEQRLEDLRVLTCGD
jgi:hypothetical protein